MTERLIKHEVKLQKSVIIILGVLALGVCANAFGPTLGVKDAMAQLADGARIHVFHGGYIKCDSC